MLDLLSIPEKDMNKTTVLIQREILNRGWSANVPYSGSSLCFIKRDDGKEIRIFSATPPTTSFAAGYLANDKFATHELLSSNGFPMLPTVLLNRNQEPDEIVISDMLSASSLVVKPIDGGHGRGITVGIRNRNKLHDAIELAHLYTQGNIIIQQMYESPTDIRILVINGVYIASCIRTPARIRGDGISSVKELIEQENSELRGEPYRSRIAKIDIPSAHEYLGEDINAVPGLGEYVNVIGIANYGAGGEVIDCTDLIPPWMQKMSIEISKVMSLPVCGVDYLISTAPTEKSTLSGLKPVITEVNKCPSLQIHEMPTHGLSRPVVAAYLDYLAVL